jgi:site-specific DNA recombinase
MGNSVLFNAFAKGVEVIKVTNKSCVIYTRVSTKEQADNNMSLQTQIKACEQYALKNNYEIMGFFGGTYESAKNDERKEFNKMLAFVKKSRSAISHILVYSVDRFSRSGANAIYIAEQLKKEGISLYAVTQPTDTSTASGSLQQNIQFIFSEYENQLRKQKCMSGIREMLERGEWCTKPPLGYDIVKREGKRSIVINEKGKLLRKAFLWKLKDKLSNEEIIRRLSMLGLTIRNQKMSEMLRNPFYCGRIVHNQLQGQVVKGIHEPLITEEEFLEVNNIIAKRAQGYSVKIENDSIPLKQFFKCDSCGRYLRAYKAYKNQKYYYKCPTIGCCCNKRADELHTMFSQIIKGYSLDLHDEDLKYLIKLQMLASYNQNTSDNKEERAQILSSISLIDQKLERLEERYVIQEELTKEMYEKFSAKLKAGKQSMELELTKLKTRVSNLEECIENAIRLCSNLSTVWDLSDYKGKHELQFLMFPEGIYYNRKTEGCRTSIVNPVIAHMSSLASVSNAHEKRDNQNILIVPCSVARSGIEPETFGL